jgi:RNA polymerase sigma-70 factor, ECF subfamily
MIEPGIGERVDGCETLDDDTLVQQILRDPQRFAILYRRYAARVYRYLYGRLGNQADAEDLTSQVFLEALQALPRYRPQGAFPAWLFSIARCQAIDRGRKSRENFSLAWIENLPTPEEDPLTEVIQAEALHRLAILYGRLVEPKQELIRLRFAADLTYGQIAKVLGRSEAAVGMAITRLLNELNRSWEEENE